MRHEEFEKLLILGNALWLNNGFDPVVNTVGAVASEDLTPERAFEKMTAALFRQAKAKDRGADRSIDLSELNRGFFRLSVEDRFLLAGLWNQNLSYGEVAGALQVAVSEVDRKALEARLRFTAETYPGNPQPVSGSCPVYEIDRPWTQRFLDDQFETAQDRFLLQRHLTECSPCQIALARFREFYFQGVRKLDRQIRKPTEEEIVSLETLWEEGQVLYGYADASGMQILRAFWKKVDLRFLFGIAFLILLMKFKF